MLQIADTATRPAVTDSPRTKPRHQAPPEVPHPTPRHSGDVRPLRSFRRNLALALIAADILLLIAAGALAFAFRQAALGYIPDSIRAVQDGSWMLGAGWLLALALCGGYDYRYVSFGPEFFRAVLSATLWAAGGVGTAVYLSGLDLSRAFFLAFFIIGPAFLLLDRFIARRIVNRLRRQGRLQRRMVVVGALAHVSSVAETMSRETWLGYDVVGAVTPDGLAASAGGVTVLGRSDNLLSVVHEVKPSVLLFTDGTASSTQEFRRIAWQLEDEAVDLIVVPSMSEVARDRLRMRPVAGLPLVHVDPPRGRMSLRWSKRVFDIVASSVLLLVLSPVLAIIAAVIRLHDGEAVFFKQVRIGRNGQEFHFLKFRSMGTDAEKRRNEVFGHGGDRGNTIMYKLENDPRVTRPGRVLRRYSLDELPQLWNVLRGDMSLVGPRPALPMEVDAYDDDARRRLTVRPGITGLWQVSGRSNLSWQDTVRLDLYYVDNWSFVQDVQILVRTARAVLASDGAY